MNLCIIAQIDQHAVSTRDTEVNITHAHLPVSCCPGASNFQPGARK